MSANKGKARKAMKTKSASTVLPTNTEPFPFMDLPPELRNHVYAYALPIGATVLITRRGDEWKKRLRKRTSAKSQRAKTAEAASSDNGDHRHSQGHYVEDTQNPTTGVWTSRKGTLGENHGVAVIWLNKQVSSEALAVLFGNTDFIFDNPTTLEKFLETAKEEMKFVEYIRYISPLSQLRNETLTALGGLPKLETFDIAGEHLLSQSYHQSFSSLRPRVEAFVSAMGIQATRRELFDRPRFTSQDVAYGASTTLLHRAAVKQIDAEALDVIRRALEVWFFYVSTGARRVDWGQIFNDVRTSRQASR